jgi:hypothetical protein
MSTMMIEVARPSLITADLLDQVNEKFEKTEDSPFSPLQDMFSGRTIQQR